MPQRGNGIGRGGMAGNSIWKGWTGSPKDVGWGSWAEGENHTDKHGGPGLKAGVPGFGMRVLGWGFVPPNLLFFFTTSPALP